MMSSPTFVDEQQPQELHHSQAQQPQHRTSCSWPLHYACRTGDLDQIQYLVEVLHHKVNQADDFDATPLYLAAYCGHTDVCRYLLEHGARCDEEGAAARIYYVALTPELRQLLREWSLSAASRDPFLELLVSLTKDPSNKKTSNNGRNGVCHRTSSPTLGQCHHHHADCYWETSDTTFHLHKVILHAVCPRLLDHLDETNRIAFAAPMGHDDCFDTIEDEAVLASWLVEYLYSGQCEVRGSVNRIQRFADLAQMLNLDSLHHALQRTLLTAASGEKRILSCTVRHQVHECLARLARRITRTAAAASSSSDTAATDDDGNNDAVPYCNLTLMWGEEEASRRWLVHTVLIVPQSDFFAGALRGDFDEARCSTIDLTQWAPSHLVVDLAVQWLYCDSFVTKPSEVPIDVAVAVVEFGAAILCPRLSQYTAQVCLMPNVAEDNVWELLALARFYQLERLQDACVAVVAQCLPVLADSVELCRVFRDEIRSIVQEGDVRILDVPLAAEIRRHLRQIWSSSSSSRDGSAGLKPRPLSKPSSSSSSLHHPRHVLDLDEYRTSMELLERALTKAIGEEQQEQPVPDVEETPSSS